MDRSTANIVNLFTLFLLCWVTLYAVVYLFAFSNLRPSFPFFHSENLNDPSDTKLEARTIDPAAVSTASNIYPRYFKVNEPDKYPFQTNGCKEIYATFEGISLRSSIVIVVKNDDNAAIARTLQSLTARTPIDMVDSVVIVDDRSYPSLTDKFPTIKGSFPNVKILRNNKWKGFAKSRNIGASWAIREKKSDVIVFLETGIEVADNWLQPLIHVISESRNAKGRSITNVIVSSITDVIDPDNPSIILSGEAASVGFDWSLDSFPVFEPMDDALNSFRRAETDPYQSAIAGTGIQAMYYSTFLQLGGFDEAIFPGNGHEIIELSIRNWMCGSGLVLISPCSRIARPFGNLHAAAFSTLNYPYKEEDADRNALYISSLYFGPDFADWVRLERFVDRVPYLELDAGGIPHLSDFIPDISHRMSTLHKELHEESELKSILSMFEVADSEVTATGSKTSNGNANEPPVVLMSKTGDHSLVYRRNSKKDGKMASIEGQISTNSGKFPVPHARFLHYKDDDDATGPISSSSTSCQSFDWFLKSVYPSLQTKLNSIMSQVEADGGKRYDHTQVINRYIQPMVDNALNEVSQYSWSVSEVEAAENELEEWMTIRESVINKEMGIGKKKIEGEESDRQKHERRIKSLEICEDYDVTECQDINGIEKCASDPSSMFFTCTKFCGWCGVDEKSKKDTMCVDLYLKKCPLWAETGDCDSNVEFMETNCRHACGFCKLASDVIKPKIVVGGGNKEVQSGLDSHGLGSGKVIDVANLRSRRMKSLELPIDETAVVGDLDYGRLHWDSMMTDTTPLAQSCKSIRDGDKAGTSLVDKIEIIGRREVEQDSKATRTSKVSSSVTIDNQMKLLCIVYTFDKNHETNLKAVEDTWGPKCDGFISPSTLDNLNMNAINLTHTGPEEYNNIWQKIRSTWNYAWTNYGEDYDWFLIGGDDMYIIVENMKQYLQVDLLDEFDGDVNKFTSTPLFLGRRFKLNGDEKVIFNSGGSGYVLNKAALRILVEDGLRQDNKCFAKQVGFWEDVNVASCLSSLGVLPYDTRDDLERERFNPFTPGSHVTYKIPPNVPDWYAKYSIDLKTGLDCCSRRSTSFHYLKQDNMRKLHLLLYYC